MIMASLHISGHKRNKLVYRRLTVCSIFWKQVRDIETLFEKLWFAIDIIYVLNFIVQ